MKSSSPEHDLRPAVWSTSSYSGGSGGNCVEVALAWRKSSHSGGEGGNCLEVAEGHPGIVPVRDSKAPDGPKLVFGADAWSAFLGGLGRR
ncbi:DUF397 domain-containing protein [Streptomyces sp. NPDC006984]|uniref:DUF397 domain-containing protein n=1 Tax=Streptomyces sp. NPDC006984 TaxID=3155463 RepID=UPI0033EA2C40